MNQTILLDAAFRASGQRVRFRGIDMANAREIDTASWLISDALEPGTYPEDALQKMEFSRQYLFANSDELAYLFSFPEFEGYRRLVVVGFEGEHAHPMSDLLRMGDEVRIYPDTVFHGKKLMSSVIDGDLWIGYLPTDEGDIVEHFPGQQASSVQPFPLFRNAIRGQRRAISPAYFSFTDTDGETNFVVMITCSETIAHARRILQGQEQTKVHVQGTIVKQAVDYNPGWSFHIAPESVGFFELAMEVCDASAEYVEKHLEDVGGATLPGSHWCPWSSRLVAELVPGGCGPSP